MPAALGLRGLRNVDVQIDATVLAWNMPGSVVGSWDPPLSGDRRVFEISGMVVAFAVKWFLFLAKPIDSQCVAI